MNKSRVYLYSMLPKYCNTYTQQKKLRKMCSIAYCNIEPEILYLAYLELEVTSSAIVGLNAFLASPNLP